MTQWKTIKLPECLDRSPKATKIPRKHFRKSGEYPVVSQEKNLINGYWNKSEDVVSISSPVIIFGDHTQVVKFVDFNFVVGADGVKLLVPRPFLDTRYFYYFLLGNPLKSLGYARHFRQLKEIDVVVPPIPEQKRIVAILDEAFAGIDTAIANTKKNLANTHELFDGYLKTEFSQSYNGWYETQLVEVCSEIFAGGDVPKGNCSNEPTTKHQVPIFTNGEKNQGLYGYTNLARVTAPSITISARGTIGYTQIRNEAFYPAIRLIVVVPKPSITDIDFLYYAITAMTISHSGTSIPQLTVPMVRKFQIAYPELDKQKAIAEKLTDLAAETRQLESIYQQKLTALTELKQSLLQKAFSGELTANTDTNDIRTAVDA